MTEQAVQRVSERQFLAFTEGREERWELVDGVPSMMAGAGRSHDRVVANCLRVLGNQLRGRTCEPFTADTFIRIPGGNYRMPDAGVDCGVVDEGDRAAGEPRLVVEVLSPSTRYFDLFKTLEEYKSVPSLDHILLVDPDQPQATLWSRGEAGWGHATVSGLEARVELPRLELSLPMVELYDRVTFPPRPVLGI